MSKWTLIISVILFVSCQKNEDGIGGILGKRILKLGHAGMGVQSIYPRNSITSLLKCLDTQADGTELDVQMTIDSVLVAYHDHELSASTNLSGLINEHTYEEVRSGHYLYGPYKSFNIVSLQEILSSVPHPGDHVYTLDCKLHPAIDEELCHRTFIRAIRRLADEFGVITNFKIESENTNFLKSCRPTLYGTELYYYTSQAGEGISVAKEMGLDGITISNSLVSSQDVDEAHDKGLKVTIWDVIKKSDNLSAARKRPDCIQTDEIKSLIRLLR